MKKNCKSVLAALMAMLICLTIGGCSGNSPKNIEDINEDDINNALAELNKPDKETAVTTPVVIEEIDPFEGFEISFSGISPNGNAELKTDMMGHIVGGNPYVTYKVDKQNKLKNGDKVTITAELNYAGKSKYTLSQTEKEYTVEGLTAYAQKLADIPAGTMKKMDKTFQDGYSAYITKNGNGAIKSMKLLGNYILSAKSSPTYGDFNYIYLVYKVVGDFSEREPDLANKEYYWCSYYKNVTVLPDGTISADFEDLHMGNMNYFLVDSRQIKGCDDLDTLFEKNVTVKTGDYDYESTVK